MAYMAAVMRKHGYGVGIIDGYAMQYDKDELIGKKIVVFANLKAAELRGIKSEGMVLAAVEEGDEEKVVLLSPEEEIVNGAKIR